MSELDQDAVVEALRADDADALAALLADGGELSTHSRTTVAHLAALWNAVSCLRAIKAMGREMAAQDTRRWTPVHSAAATTRVPNGTAAALEFLVREGGLDVNARAKDKKTPLHIACQVSSDARENIATALIALGADLNAVDWDGNSPVMVAASCGQRRMVKLMLEHNADTTILNKKKKTLTVLLGKNFKFFPTLVEGKVEGKFEGNVRKKVEGNDRKKVEGKKDRKVTHDGADFSCVLLKKLADVRRKKAGRRSIGVNKSI